MVAGERRELGAVRRVELGIARAAGVGEPRGAHDPIRDRSRERAAGDPRPRRCEKPQREQ
jgi:hypothetical protein